MEPEGSLPHSQAPATNPILSQLDPVHDPTFHFLKIHLNIIPAVMFSLLRRSTMFLSAVPVFRSLLTSNIPVKLFSPFVLI